MRSIIVGLLGACAIGIVALACSSNNASSSGSCNQSCFGQYCYCQDTGVYGYCTALLEEDATNPDSQCAAYRGQGAACTSTSDCVTLQGCTGTVQAGGCPVAFMLTCDPTSSRCMTSCATSNDCPYGEACTAGECQGGSATGPLVGGANTAENANLGPGAGSSGGASSSGSSSGAASSSTSSSGGTENCNDPSASWLSWDDTTCTACINSKCPTQVSTEVTDCNAYLICVCQQLAAGNQTGAGNCPATSACTTAQNATTSCQTGVCASQCQ